MKKLFLMLILGIVCFSTVNDVMINNKALGVKNRLITFNDENYTGKINVNLNQNGEGYFNLVNGMLDGQTELTFKGSVVKFNIINGYYEGELVRKDSNSQMEMFFEKQILKRYKMENKDFSLNIRFNNYGRASGIINFKNEEFKHEYFKKFGIQFSGNKLEYKNGTAILDKERNIKFYVSGDNKIVEEFYENNKLIQKFEEEVAKANVTDYQNFLIQILQ